MEDKMAYKTTDNPAIMHLIAEVSRVQNKIDRLEKIKKDFKTAIDVISAGSIELEKTK
jgi:hypothetical protein